ncbi:IclR family transcriptional regulator [Marinactinospora thermotolerans]|uniref:Glycerol operon regulatory protein n=1 Tax=Marinactinospora thermotolerans DSM 45154 TaxID=1122192 RepID=A0A1T4SLQ5_9ACTN|nr:IclR family transcriptional regulator [Marinactinospora thermotolerans]SKA29105.1 transcriptional regulator, IclR family [Marinactinospora thermotolerans DSM 45154]
MQSVDRAVTVLEILARYGQAGVTEIAGELGVHKSTAFRLVGALERRGLVEQPGSRGKYRLGIGVVRLAGAMTTGLVLVRHSRPVCEVLAAELEATVDVAVPGDGGVVNVDRVTPAPGEDGARQVGRAGPLHASSTGKVLLAHMRHSERGRVLRGSLEQVTPETVTVPEQLRAQLDEVLERGYATEVGERQAGLNAVAAPIRAADGQVVAAVGVTAPSTRMPTGRLGEIGAEVVAAARKISARLGGG